MKIAVSGTSGMIGSALAPHLRDAGHSVVRLARTPSTGCGPDELSWNPATGRLDRGRMEGMDAVVHLAGEPIMGRWTPLKKERIRDSRVAATRMLVETLTGLVRPPRILLCASAVGYYGTRGDTILTEASPAGSGFLAEVCVDWEAAATLAVRAGLRVAFLRFGVVLHPAGGALAALLPLYRLGLGGSLGSGNQYMSWIALSDAVRAILHILEHDDIKGPINLVAPQPVRQKEFARLLGRALSHPAWIPAPALALKLAYGELAGEVLLASARAEPSRLKQAGFSFMAPELETALKTMLFPPR